MNGLFCRQVIGKNMGQPVFCDGNLVPMVFKDPDNNRTYKFQVCRMCGKSPDLHNPEILKKVRETIHAH